MSDMSRINESVWFQKNSAMEYARDSLPFPAELEVLVRFDRELKEASVLDIGIGAGRTTSFLNPVCAQYIGIDYSLEMVELARRKFPDVKIDHMDARSLSHFSDKSFDMVWFSYNGMDYVSHGDRLQILAEVKRVLKPGGLFIFSSHNRDVAAYPAWHPVNIRFAANPIRLGKNIVKYLLGIVNTTKLTAHETQTKEYAIRNDQAQGYQLLTYYISLSRQVEQLQKAGFSVEVCLGVNGEVLEKNSSYLDGYSIYYVARAC